MTSHRDHLRRERGREREGEREREEGGREMERERGRRGESKIIIRYCTQPDSPPVAAEIPKYPVGGRYIPSFLKQRL